MLAAALAACGNGIGGFAAIDDAAVDASPAAADARADGPRQVFADVHVAWNVQTAAGTAQPCPSDYATAVLIARPDGSDGSGGIGAPILDQFDCATGSGTATYEVGSYTFELDLANDLDTDVYAASLVRTLDLEATTSLAFPIITDGGYFQLAWTLVGGTSGATLTCAAAGATTIDVSALASDGITTTTSSFDCAAGSGVSTAMASGAYSATVRAAAADASTVGTAPALASETIAAQNRVTDWGSVQITVAGD